MAAEPASNYTDDRAHSELDVLAAKQLENTHLLTLYDYAEDTRRAENAVIAEKIQNLQIKLLSSLKKEMRFAARWNK